MNIRYIGTRPRDVAPVRHREFHVEPGEVVEVNDELGASLLEQTRLFELAGCTPPAQAPARRPRASGKGKGKAEESATTEGNDD